MHAALHNDVEILLGTLVPQGIKTHASCEELEQVIACGMLVGIVDTCLIGVSEWLFLRSASMVTGALPGPIGRMVCRPPET